MKDWKSERLEGFRIGYRVESVELKGCRIGMCDFMDYTGSIIFYYLLNYYFWDKIIFIEFINSVVTNHTKPYLKIKNHRYFRFLRRQGGSTGQVQGEAWY